MTMMQQSPSVLALALALTFCETLCQGATTSAATCPRGIYVLDSQAGSNVNGVSMRDANIRTNAFVTGYVLRSDWSTMEPTRDQFDFTIIDWNIRRLAAADKKLSFLFINTDPVWIAQTPGVTTWYDSSLGRNRAVPWNSFLLIRFETFLHALAEHTIDGVKFKDHPVLAIVNTGLPGAKLAIRDPSPVLLRDLPGYSRTNLTAAVLQCLGAAVTNFPTKFVQIGFWPVTDSQYNPALWEELRQAVLSEFNGGTQPRVGFWMENLAASRTAPGQDPVAGKPVTSFGSPLFLSQTETWANFQALTSWYQPFNNYNSSVANATPADGMFYANSTYGSTYFELYVADIDYPGYRAEFDQWHARLFPPDQITLSTSSPGSIQIQWPSWPGGVYQMESSTDLRIWSNVGEPIIATTNQSVWTGNFIPPIRFYRLRTLP